MTSMDNLYKSILGTEDPSLPIPLRVAENNKDLYWLMTDPETHS